MLSRGRIQFRAAPTGRSPDTLAEELDCTVLFVHSREPRRHTVLRYLLERFAS